MDDAYQIFNYLPLRFKNRSEEEYVRYLWDSFESNIKEEKYQFSFIAYHMLFMSFIYFNLWQIKTIRKEDFDKIKLGFSDDFSKASNPFLFSCENESRIFDLLKYLCASHADVKALIGQYKTLVKERNSVAHANGNIPFRNINYLNTRISDIIRYANEIQPFCKPIIQDCFSNFLINSQDVDSRTFFDLSDQVYEILIHEYYLSKKDLEFCLEFDIKKLKAEPNYGEIKNIYNKVSSIYSEN